MSKMMLSGWGNYPKIEVSVHKTDSAEQAKEFLQGVGPCITRGLGRSYGDSSLSENVLLMLKLNRMLSFDAKDGVLSCESGVSLGEILDTFVPRGWFLPVTPGTKYVTLGGAIASDVHGKNHHKDGSFSEHLVSMDVMTSDGKAVTCSKTVNADLFKATCGGMGLTGIILGASLRLKRIETAYIRQTTVKAKNIDETMDLFEKYENFTYSVAWIDCLSKKENLGRSILILGEHAGQTDIKDSKDSKNALVPKKKTALNIPVMFPNAVLNSVTARCFNFLYYHKHPDGITESIVDYDSFFYPLDGIRNWNRIYGPRGFTQYQFVLPYAMSKEGLKKILTVISDSGRGSFLAVLKLFGKKNDNLLSFPMEGYTLALDFPINTGLFPFLDELDKIVLDHGGRLYLTKDARMGREMFIKGYENTGRFLTAKHSVDKDNKFQSYQSKRLGV
jgi:decaprenylphospho-beta-D-ribofuranose 2-oxidase